MGCDFVFTNETTNESAPLTINKCEPYENLSLSKNINRGSVHHLINVIITIMNMNEWKPTDTIKVECCCSSYTYQNNTLFNNYSNELMVDNGTCSINKCDICNLPT